LASDEWPAGPGPRRALVLVRPSLRRAPKGSPSPPTRWPPGGGCAVGSPVCRSRGSGAPRGGRVGGRPGAPSLKARPRLRRGALSPSFPRAGRAYALLLPARGSVAWGRADGSRSLRSVSSVRGARRRLSPWFRAVGSLCRGSGLPKEPFPLTPGPGGSRFRGSGPVGSFAAVPAPEGAFPVARGPLGPSPWVGGPMGPVAGGSGPRGSFAAVPAPEGAFPVVRGPLGPSPRFGGPVGPSPRFQLPKEPSPWFGARWVRRRGSGPGGGRRRGSGARWVRLLGSGPQIARAPV
jgi:hypothetical protein